MVGAHLAAKLFELAREAARERMLPAVRIVQWVGARLGYLIWVDLRCEHMPRGVTVSHASDQGRRHWRNESLEREQSRTEGIEMNTRSSSAIELTLAAAGSTSVRGTDATGTAR